MVMYSLSKTNPQIKQPQSCTDTPHKSIGDNRLQARKPQ